MATFFPKFTLNTLHVSRGRIIEGENLHAAVRVAEALHLTGH